jgi:hypothetical protein
MTNNKRLTRVLEFDLADAPMLLHAMRIGANTAMMCGHRDAQERLKRYGAMLKEFISPVSDIFDPECWAEIGMALADAKECRVGLAPRAHDTSWSPTLFLSVVVDGRRFRDTSWMGYKRDSPIPEKVCEALRQLAPVNCLVEVGLKETTVG